MDVRSTGRLSNNWGKVAFGVVILAGYIVWLTNGDTFPEITDMLLVTLLTAAFWGMGTWGNERITQTGNLLLIGAYFGVMLVLGGLIGLSALGLTWMILLPLASQAVEQLPKKWPILVCAAVWLMQLAPLVILHGTANLNNWGPQLLAAIVFVATFTQITVSEQQARADLSQANQKLRQYALQAEEVATIQERNRLAREIHDGLGHYLTAINIQIKAAQAVVAQDPSQAGEALQAAQDLSQEALADVRRSVSALRADPTTSRLLPEVLEGLLAETRAAGIQAELKVEGTPTHLLPQLDFTLYRAAQESLTNVRKHANASRVDLSLAYRPTSVVLAVRDDGEGAAPESQSEGFGLTGVQERVQMVGGTLKVNTAPGQGFALEVTVPRTVKE